MRIRGRNAVITGASSGVGREIALDLARRGASVALVGRDEARLRDVAALIRELGSTAHVLVCDVQVPPAIARTARDAEAALGPIHILVNAAGVGFWRPFMDTTVDEHQAMMETNYWGTFWWIRRLLPGMADRRSGCIVNVSSGSGKIAFGVTGGYSASKFAVTGLSEALYREYRSRGVRVACVHPASVRTAFWSDARISLGKVPPLIRRSPKISARSVARNVRWMIRTGMPVRTLPVFLALMVRVNALWIRAGDLMLWRWFIPVLLLVLLLMVLT